MTVKQMNFNDETGVVNIEQSNGVITKYTMDTVLVAVENGSGGLDMLDPRNGTPLAASVFGWSGMGGGTTAEEVQDFMNSALVHAGHTGVSVVYNDVSNRFEITNASASLSRKINLTVNSQIVNLVVRGFGTNSDLSAITATSSLDGTNLVITMNNVGSFKIDSVAVYVPANANAGTSFTLTIPDPVGATSIADSGLASLSVYNDSGVVQSSTPMSLAITGSNLVVTKSSLVANTAYRFKVVY